MTPGVARFLGVLIRASDLSAFQLDWLNCGSVFVAPTDERVDGEIVYRRVPPGDRL